jgi:hypothetical protein
MTKPTTLDKIQEALLSPPHKTVKLDKREQAIRERYEKAFSFWQQNPHLPDKKIVNFLVNQCGVSRSLAYLDLRNIKYLLGCVRTLSKEWYRHMVIEMCRSAYIMAKTRKDPKGMALAADKIGKYLKLDKDEEEPLPWDQLIPPNFEPDADVAILGIDPIPDIEAHRQKLRRQTLAKYDPGSFQQAVDVTGEDEKNS